MKFGNNATFPFPCIQLFKSYHWVIFQFFYSFECFTCLPWKVHPYINPKICQWNYEILQSFVLHKAFIMHHTGMGSFRRSRMGRLDRLKKHLREPICYSQIVGKYWGQLMSLVTITGQDDDFAVDGLAPKSGTPLSLRGSGFTHLVVSLCFPILLYFSICLSTVSYTHLTLPTNREV